MIDSAPFFSWTCLFPQDASYRFAPHTQWAREGGGSFGGGGGAVYVTSGPSPAALPDLGGYDGLVALNRRGLSDRALREAGFLYVRRFAVLPGASKPRWFIPLDAPAVSAGGFCLSVPFKAAASLRYHGGRAAARLGLPGWYRDQLLIAQRSIPSVEHTIQNLFPGRPLRLAISSGTPPPAINRKISLAVLAAGGRVRAYAKLPGPGEISRNHVRREAEALARLGRHPGRPLAPRLLFAGDAGGRYLVVSAPLHGRPPGPDLTDDHSRFLAALRSDRVTCAADTALARALWDRRPLLAARPDLARALHELMPVLGAVRLASATVHGDFAPWNLRRTPNGLVAFDWEYAQTDGLPLIDQTHHLLAVGYLLRRWTPEQACGRLAAAAAASPLGLPQPTARALQRTYLLDYVLRLFSEGHGDDYPRVAWCREIIARMSPPAVKGVAA